MVVDPLLPSRIQFAYVVSSHIIFVAFTIRLAARLATIEGIPLKTGNRCSPRHTYSEEESVILRWGLRLVAVITNRCRLHRDRLLAVRGQLRKGVPISAKPQAA